MTEREEAAYRLSCPLCLARKGEPCLYLEPAPRMEHRRSPGYQAQLDRAGTPTKQPHAERFAKVDKYLRQARRAQELKVMKATQPPWLAPLRAFDAAEYEQMRDWLRENWHLFRLRRLP